MPFWPNVTSAYCGWGPTSPLALNNPEGTHLSILDLDIVTFCTIFPKPTPVGWEGMIALPHTVVGRTSTSPVVVHARPLGPPSSHQRPNPEASCLVYY